MKVTPDKLSNVSKSSHGKNDSRIIQWKAIRISLNSTIFPKRIAARIIAIFKVSNELFDHGGLDGREGKEEGGRYVFSLVCVWSACLHVHVTG